MSFHARPQERCDRKESQHRQRKQDGRRLDGAELKNHCVTSVMVTYVRPVFPRLAGQSKRRPVALPCRGLHHQRRRHSIVVLAWSRNADISVITDPSSDKFDLEAAIKHWAGEKA